MGLPARQVVHGRKTERRIQLPGSALEKKSQQAGFALGSGRRVVASIHLCRVARPRVPVRERTEFAGRKTRRLRRDLLANDSGAADCDAVVRANRGRTFSDLWRI